MSGGLNQSSFTDLMALDPPVLYNILYEHLSDEMDIEDEEIRALADVIFNMASHQARFYKYNSSIITPSLDVLVFRYLNANPATVDDASNIPQLLQGLERVIIGRNNKQHIRVVEIMANVKQLAKNTMAARIQEAAMGFLPDYEGDLSNTKEYLTALGFDDLSVSNLANSPHLRSFMIILYLFYVLAALKIIVLQNSEKLDENELPTARTNPVKSKMDLIKTMPAINDSCAPSVEAKMISSVTHNDNSWKIAFELQQKRLDEMQSQQMLMLTKLTEYMQLSDNNAKPAITNTNNGKRNNLIATIPMSKISNTLPSPTAYGTTVFPSNIPLHQSALEDDDEEDEDYPEEQLRRGTNNHQSLSNMITQMQSPSAIPGKNQYYTNNMAELRDSYPNSNTISNNIITTSTEEIARAALITKLTAMYAIGRNPSIDEHLATQAAYGSVVMDIRGLLVHYTPIFPKQGYSAQKISSTLFGVGNNTSLLGMADSAITRHGPMVTVEQSLAFFNEQMLKCFIVDDNYPCMFPPVDAMNHILFFRDRVTTLIDSTLSGTSKAIIQDNQFHVTTYAALRMFIITTWNRAMLLRDLSLLLKDFDTIWSQHYEKYLLKTAKGYANIPLNEALTLLYYSCQNCGKLGTVLDICTNPKCTSASSKSTSSTTSTKDSKHNGKTQFTPAYSAAIKAWRATFDADAPRASKSDSAFRNTNQFKALSATDKVATNNTAKATSSSTTGKGNIHMEQSRIELHLCPNFRN